MKIKVKLLDKTKEELKGLQGVQGEKGDKGDVGTNGLNGKNGDKGDPGRDGKPTDKIIVTNIKEAIPKEIKVTNPYDDKRVVKLLEEIKDKDLSVVTNIEKMNTDDLIEVLKEIRDKPTISSISGGGGKSIVNLKNVAGTTINPATEDGNLATIAGKDFATQTTLALIKAKTDNIPTDPAKESGKLTNIDTNLVYCDTDAVTVVSLLPDGINVMPSMDALTRAGYVQESGSVSARKNVWASATVNYQGWALAGTLTSASSWRIRKRVFSTDDFTDTWADGDTLYNNKWDDYLTLTYS